MTLSIEQDFVFKTIKSRDVHFVRFWFTDIFGQLKSFSVIPSELEEAFEEGMGFDGSAIAGFGHAMTTEMIIKPDAETFQVLPWCPATDAVARMFGEVLTPQGKPYSGDSRSVLRRVVDKAHQMGYILNTSPELEYYYFKSNTELEPLDYGSYFDCTSLDKTQEVRRDTVLALEKMGIPVEFSHHEGGPSQSEIDLRYCDVMNMADNVMTYKEVVKSVAQSHGVYASFMPQPFAEYPGNGMHVHQSLLDCEGNNLFYDESDEQGYCLSKLAKHYLAGLLRYAVDYCLITNPCVNSYKRLASTERAARHVVWAHRSPTALVRIPRYKPNKVAACRLEVRNPDSAANPYLAFACMLAAGLRGIEEELELPAPHEGIDLRNLSLAQLEEQGIKVLPQNLGEAIYHFEQSEFMRELLGDHIHSYIVQEKRKEWQSYKQSISQWEIDRYLGVL